MKIEKFNINNIDIGNLRLFSAIAETGSVSMAAEKCGMTQSTASYGLEKMRRAFRDPLFERGAQGMILTDNGADILENCQKALLFLDQAGQNRPFDPVTTRRDFIIAASEFEIQTLLVPLTHLFLRQYPLIRLVIVHLKLNQMVHHLDQDWDMALMATPVDTPLLHQRILFETPYVTFYNPEYRQAPATIDLFCQARHAIVRFGNYGHQHNYNNTQIDQCLAQMGRQRDIAVIAESFQSLAQLIHQSDVITTLPPGLAPFQVAGFNAIACPIPLDHLSIRLVWHRRKHQDPALKWLRQQIHDIRQQGQASSIAVS